MALYVCRIKVALKQHDHWTSLHAIIIPASVVHIGSRHKIGDCFVMTCNSNVVPMQYLLKV